MGNSIVRQDWNAPDIPMSPSPAPYDDSNGVLEPDRQSGAPDTLHPHADAPDLPGNLVREWMSDPAGFDYRLTTAQHKANEALAESEGREELVSGV